jgi:hypothetical protein
MNTMQDLYLKFPDQSTADTLLYVQIPTAFDTDGDPTEWEPRQVYQNTDVIGIIYEHGEWDAEGDQITPPIALEGWHVNIRLMEHEDGTALLPYAVTPTHPRRTWA